MIVAALQMCPAQGDRHANLRRIEEAAIAASTIGAKLLVAPELAVTGYAQLDVIGSLAEPRGGPSTRFLDRLSGRLNIAIVCGMPEREGDDIFNVAIATLPNEAPQYYRKCHLFGDLEARAFTPGSDPSPIFRIGNTKTSMLICYDVEFPEWTRTAAMNGAELVAVPTALPKSTANDRISTRLLPARALENHLSIIYAGLCGVECDTEYQGGSCIIGPDGEDLVRAGSHDALIITDISYPRNSSQGDPYLQDRRPSLYGRVSKS